VLVRTQSAEETFLKLLPAIERISAFVTRRHHASAEEAQEFSSYVKEKLIEHDYGVIGRFEGRSSIETFLVTVISNYFHDFRNREWGKWRPSAAARRGGPAAIQLERYLVRDGLTFDQACESLSSNRGVTLDRSELERLAATLPVRFRRRVESEEVLRERAAPDSPDRPVLDEERRALWDRVMKVLAAEQAKMPPQDAQILAMKFEDGAKVSEIAATLRIDQKPLYERLKRVLKRLRLALAVQGIDEETIRTLLSDED
jgi:RNA polymerase sigma factor (sigma-70 family)